MSYLSPVSQFSSLLFLDTYQSAHAFPSNTRHSSEDLWGQEYKNVLRKMLQQLEHSGDANAVARSAFTLRTRQRDAATAKLDTLKPSRGLQRCILPTGTC